MDNQKLIENGDLYMEEVSRTIHIHKKYFKQNQIF